MIRNDLNLLNTFSLIIATDINQDDLIRLAEHCWDMNIPLVHLMAYGFYGLLRIQVLEHASKL